MSDIVEKWEARRASKRPAPPIASTAIAVGVMILWTLATIGNPKSYLSTAATEGMAYAVGYIAGGAMVSALLVWLVVYFGFVRRSRPQWGGGLFIALAAVSFGLQLLGLAGISREVEQEQAATARSEIAQVMNEFATKGVDANVSREAKSTGQSGLLEALMRRMMVDTIEAARRYASNLEALDLEAHLEPRALARPGGMDAALTQLRKGRALVAARRVELQDQLDSVRQQVTESKDINEANKRSFLEGFDKSRNADSSTGAFRQLELQDEILALGEANVKLLRDNRSAWQIEQGELAFHDAAKMATFNDRARRVASLSVEYERSVAEQQQRLARDSERFLQGR